MARINNNGEVVFESAPAGGSHALFWKDGLVTDLGLGHPCGINAYGQVVGSSNEFAVMWENGIITYIGKGDAYDINDSGKVVGSSGNDIAFIWDSKDGMQEIGTLGGFSVGLGINT